MSCVRRSNVKGWLGSVKKGLTFDRVCIISWNGRSLIKNFTYGNVSGHVAFENWPINQLSKRGMKK